MDSRILLNTPLRMIGRIAFLFVLAVLLLGIATQTASAQQQPPTDNEVNAIAKGMYCPVCENIPLDVCPTQACAQWRELIRQKLADGWSEQQIKDYFVAQYGDRVLAEPPASGLNWLVYILPPVILLVGIYIVYRVFRGMRKTNSAVLAAPVETKVREDPYLSKLEEELRQRQSDDL